MTQVITEEISDFSYKKISRKRLAFFVGGVTKDVQRRKTMVTIFQEVQWFWARIIVYFAWCRYAFRVLMLSRRYPGIYSEAEVDAAFDELLQVQKEESLPKWAGRLVRVFAWGVMPLAMPFGNIY